MRKPKLGFSNLNPAELRKYAEQIYDMMSTASALFPSPTPSLESLREAIQAFSESVSEAAFNDRRAIVTRDLRREKLQRIMYGLSQYVDSIASGDERIILSAGFIPTQEPSGPLKSPKPTDLRATPTGIGTNSISLRVKPWKSARMYQFEYRQKGSTDRWFTRVSTKSTLLIENLEAFQAYEFRVTYLSPDPTLNYSDVISTYAL